MSSVICHRANDFHLQSTAATTPSALPLLERTAAEYAPLLAFFLE
jgi:hypothetical protein